MIFLISVFLSLVRLCVCVLCRLCCILELKTAEGWFFQRVHLCIWVKGGHELDTLSIRVHNSLTVHDNSWALKFDCFSEFQSIISDSPPYNIFLASISGTKYSRMGLMKFCGLLKSDHITSNFLKVVLRKFHLVHSWILCPIWSSICIYKGQNFTFTMSIERQHEGVKQLLRILEY